MPGEDRSVLASKAEAYTSFYGVLAGLTFTASILVYQFRDTLPLGDFLLTLTLLNTVIFIFAAALS